VSNNDSIHFLKYNPSFACVKTVTQTTTDRTMEPRSGIWGKRGVNNPTSFRTIGIKEQSRVEDWARGNVLEIERADHKAGDTVRAYNLRSTPNLADKETRARTVKGRINSQDNEVQSKRGAWGTSQYKNP
jgi:hypothetical protein